VVLKGTVSCYKREIREWSVRDQWVVQIDESGKGGRTDKAECGEGFKESIGK
jgi:hypothetical protein